ncbi:MAG: hypothetical protein FJ020_09885, partial [Chloroflexi bacterium]|nr:hypothetical protein [Chloroflexota bacterium]
MTPRWSLLFDPRRLRRHAASSSTPTTGGLWTSRHADIGEMSMNGYMDRILHVDLDKGRMWDEPLNGDDARHFAGGSGLAARIIWDRVNSDTDPLGPQNPLVFMTGPLVGTAMPSAGRYSVCALSPLTGIWGESNSGGFFGPEL